MLGSKASACNSRVVPRVDLIRRSTLCHVTLHGYYAASMRGIAAEAGFTIAALYFHCSTKEHLLFDVLESRMRQLAEGLDAALVGAPDSWAARLGVAIRFHIQSVTRDEAGASMRAAELRRLTGDLRLRHQTTRDAYEYRFRELVCGSIAAGEFEPVDVPVITAGILGIGLAVGRCRLSARLTPDEIAVEYTRFVLRALDPHLPTARSSACKTVFSAGRRRLNFYDRCAPGETAENSAELVGAVCRLPGS